MSLVVPSLRGIVASAPWAKNELWRKAQAVPSLDLRFADSKSLTDAVSGQNLITFTRASSGTYVGSDGLLKTALADVPRFDHDPETGESLGLLIEEQRTNLLTYSEDFENSDWQTTNPGEVTLITGAADPAGGNNATTLYYDSGDTGWLRRIISGTSGQPYILSFWARRRAGTGNLLAVVGDNVNQTINEVTSSWQRFSIVNTPTSSTVRVYLKVNDTGDQFDIWGAQLEAGAFPTSYIKNVDTPGGVTRNADVASITGANFSSWYRQDEGTVFAEYNPLTSIPPANQAIITIESTTNNGFRLYQQGANGRPLGQWQNPAGLQANFPFTTLNFQAGVTSKVAAAYADADFAGTSSLEPGNIAQTTTGVVPIDLTSAGIGSRSSNSTSFANGRISRLTYFDRRLPDATLQAITSP